MRRNKPNSILCMLSLYCLLTSSPLAMADTNLAPYRFFTTPGQRAALDALRERKPRVKHLATVAAAKADSVVLPRVKLDGLVKRSGGASTVWVNGRQVKNGGYIAGNTRVNLQKLSSQQVNVVLPNNQIVALQPGEDFDPNSKSVKGTKIIKRRK